MFVQKNKNDLFMWSVEVRTGEIYGAVTVPHGSEWLMNGWLSLEAGPTDGAGDALSEWPSTLGV
jgi:hypothetical protein